MTAFDDLTQAISFKYHDKIKKACSSLFSALNLNNFWYYKVTDTGLFTFFGTHLPCCEYFTVQKCYQDFFYYRHPKFFQSGISLQRSNLDPESPIIRLFTEKYDLHHSLLIVNKVNPHVVEAFGVSSKVGGDLQLVTMMNEIPLIKLFATHFRKENALIFDKLEQNQINLANLIGNNFYKSLHSESTSRQSLLKQMAMELIGDLSQNELKIVKRVLEGFSASQIALQTFRSSRTVEHYVERIKEKLGCFSKAELIQKAREFEQLGLLEYSETT